MVRANDVHDVHQEAPLDGGASETKAVLQCEEDDCDGVRDCDAHQNRLPRHGLLHCAGGGGGVLLQRGGQHERQSRHRNSGQRDDRVYLCWPTAPRLLKEIPKKRSEQIKPEKKTGVQKILY